MASTLQRDFTAPDYLFHDDPYLIPYNSLSKRDFILAKESGKEAARFVRDTHPELFEQNLIEMQPVIKSFMPKLKVTEKNATTELLENFVQSCNVADAIQTYELLVKTGRSKKMRPELRQELLEMICYHNEEEEISEGYQVQASVFKREDSKWAQGGTADHLAAAIIEEHGPDSPEAANARLAILCGMSKVGNRRGAKAMHEEIKANKGSLGIRGYNAILDTLTPESKKDQVHFEPVKSILEEMKAHGVAPDGLTLIAVLKYISNSATDASYGHACRLALSVLAEFKSIGISPSLGAYCQVLTIFYTKKMQQNSLILQDILDQLDEVMKAKGSLMDEVVSPDCFRFFREAMGGASNMRNLPLAYRVHKLVVGHDTDVLIGDYNATLNYYNFFASVVMRNEAIDVTMEWIDKMVPNVWGGRLQFYQELLMHLTVHGAPQYLPRVWTDLQASNFCRVNNNVKLDFMNKFLNALQNATIADEDDESRHLGKTFALITTEVFNYVTFERSMERHGVQPIFPKLLDQVLDLAVEYGDLKLAADTVKFCRDEIARLPGNLSEANLNKFVEAALTEEARVSDDATAVEAGVFQVILLALELNYSDSAITMATSLASKVDLKESQRSQLNSLFSHDPKWVVL